MGEHADEAIDRIIHGEPRRRKGRRGNANRLSLEEVKAMHIKGGGASRDAHMLGRKLRKIVSISGSACPGCPDNEWCHKHRACIKPNSNAP